MLYQIGTKAELSVLPRHLPEAVRLELLRGLAVLDAEYGENRDYLESGGYSLILETEEDLEALRSFLDYEQHPCEWATRIGRSGYLSALYILNDDFSVMVYMPISAAPEVILSELED